MSSDTSQGSGTTQSTGATSPTLGPSQVQDQNDPLRPQDPDSVVPSELNHRPTQRTSQIFTAAQVAFLLFSDHHLKHLLSSPLLLLKFTAFLRNRRPQSIAILVYYLDALKALKAISYANAISLALGPLKTHAFTDTPPRPVIAQELEDKAGKAFQYMVEEDLPSYITQVYINAVTKNLVRQVSSAKPPHRCETPQQPPEVFYLTDPSKPDHPIVFTSDSFHRATQYNATLTFARNWKLLLGPQTSLASICRIEEAYRSGKETCEVIPIYRRDGSTFLGLLMVAPLSDSRGKIRYFFNAVIDVSRVLLDSPELESMRTLIYERQNEPANEHGSSPHNAEFKELSKMLSTTEVQTVRRWGGRMHSGRKDASKASVGASSIQFRNLLHDSIPPPLPSSPELIRALCPKPTRGPYNEYLLLRPFPSLRILFASPSLRVSGILQSPFLSHIGGSRRVHEGLNGALAEGRRASARIRWVMPTPGGDGDGGGGNAETVSTRYVHCTPLRGPTGRVGVWVVLLVDSKISRGSRRERGKTQSSVSTVVTMCTDATANETSGWHSDASKPCNGWHDSDAAPEADQDPTFSVAKKPDRWHPRTEIVRGMGAGQWRDSEVIRTLGKAAWQGTCWREEDDVSEDERPVTSLHKPLEEDERPQTGRRAVAGQSWATQATSFLGYGTDDE